MQTHAIPKRNGNASKVDFKTVQVTDCLSQQFLTNFGKGINQGNANHNQAEASDGLPLQALAEYQIAKERDQKHPKAGPACVNNGNRDIAQRKGQEIKRKHISHH